MRPRASQAPVPFALDQLQGASILFPLSPTIAPSPGPFVRASSLSELGMCRLGHTAHFLWDAPMQDSSNPPTHALPVVILDIIDLDVYLYATIHLVYQSCRGGVTCVLVVIPCPAENVAHNTLSCLCCEAVGGHPAMMSPGIRASLLQNDQTRPQALDSLKVGDSVFGVWWA